MILSPRVSCLKGALGTTPQCVDHFLLITSSIKLLTIYVSVQFKQNYVY
jgi:hypothetical protein